MCPKWVYGLGIWMNIEHPCVFDFIDVWALKCYLFFRKFKNKCIDGVTYQHNTFDRNKFEYIENLESLILSLKTMILFKSHYFLYKYTYILHIGIIYIVFCIMYCCIHITRYNTFVWLQIWIKVIRRLEVD